MIKRLIETNGAKGAHEILPGADALAEGERVLEGVRMLGGRIQLAVFLHLIKLYAKLTLIFKYK